MKKSSKSVIRSKVKAANRQENPLGAVSTNEIFQSSSPYACECRRFRQLHLSLQKWAFDLLSSNMKDLYEQSKWGWNPCAKMEELKAANAWCLLVKKRSDNGDASVKKPSDNDSDFERTAQDDDDCEKVSEDDDGHGCVGFVHFRYDLDYGVPVLYCYEIQVAKGQQGLGIGRRMLSVLRLLAQRAGMERIVATVFKHNQGSLEFFKCSGFQEDETSPAEEDSEDYVILSMPV